MAYLPKQLANVGKHNILIVYLNVLRVIFRHGEAFEKVENLIHEYMNIT